MAKNIFSRLIRKAASNFYVTVVNTNNPAGWSTFSQTSSVTNENLIANFETVPQLFAIIEWLTKQVTRVPIKVISQRGKDRPDSALWQLIKQPNNYQSFTELIKLDIAYYELTGNSFLYGMMPDGMNQVTQLWSLPVEKTVIALRYDKSIPAWMNEVSEYIADIGGKEYRLPADMVLHERNISMRYNDGSWIYGMSKYVPGDKINRELKAIHDAKTSIIEQRGAVGFITNESEVPDPEQSKEVKEKLKSSTGYGLLGDQDKFIVTTEKLRWQQMALGVQELQLIENAKYTMAQMCEINGIDPVIFSTEGSTFANKKEAIRQAIFDVIVPLVNNRYETLSEFLAPGYNGDKIVPDWSRVEEVQADKRVMTDLLTRQIDSMIVTPYEASKQLYPEMDDSKRPPDEYFRKTSLVPAMQAKPEQPGGMLPDVDPELLRQLVEESNRERADDGN